MDAERVSLDRQTWARFVRAATVFATSEVGGRAKLLFVALLVLMVGINAMNVVNSFVGRDFMTAIEQRSRHDFLLQAALYVAVFAISTVFAVGFRFSEERLGLLWRQWLTRLHVLGYMGLGTPYRLRERGEVHNPDQRIADDVRVFTTSTLSFVLMLLNGSFTIVAFSGVLWSISPGLFAVAVGYAAVGSLLTVVLGRPLIWLNYAQSDREASFRADLVHVRENAESVALLRREGRLRSRLLRRVDELIANARRIIAVNRDLSFFTTGYNYLIQIIPALIVGPLFMRGEVEFGVITQSAMAFSHLVGAFSLIVTQFQQISSYAAVLARLGSLSEAMDRSAASASPIEIVEHENEVVWQGLTLRAPGDGRTLLSNLNAKVAYGQRVLVAGPNQSAKVALFRATAGVWSAGEGRVLRPSASNMQFVAERPYLPPGTLREALLHAGHEESQPDAKLLAVLDALGLEGMIDRIGRLDVERDWDDLLSLGEQQLLVIARVVLAAPRFAMLHRIDTTLGTEQVATALRLLTQANVTTIVLAEADPRREGYDGVLELKADGGWSFVPAPRERVAG
jgi:putative ATP-binding cassette transporter